MSDKKWKLENYSHLTEGRWKMNHDPNKDLTIILVSHSLMVVNGEKVIECYSLAQNGNGLMAILKDRTLVFYSRCTVVGTKFKVLFKSTEDAQNCAHELEKLIHITYKNEESRTTKKEETYNEVLTRLLKSGKSNILPEPQSIPDDYPLESAIKLCILEQGFSNLVFKVANNIENYGKNNINLS